jgi:hypothetical protein
MKNARRSVGVRGIDFNEKNFHIIQSTYYFPQSSRKIVTNERNYVVIAQK